MNEGSPAPASPRRIREEPCFFFQRKEFEGARAHVDPEPDMPANIEITGGQPHTRLVLLREFSTAVIQRFGVLRGDYVVHPSGTILFNRRGDCIVANAKPEHSRLVSLVGDLVNDIGEDRDTVLELWDHFRVVEHAAVMGSVYSRNYYHYMLDLLGGFRFLEDYPVTHIVMSAHCLLRPYQTDLVARVIGPRRLVPVRVPYMVRDPVLVQSDCSRETLAWLRRTLGLSAAPGKRRLYIVRDPEERVPFGNNLAETPELLRILDRFGFERINFGRGEIPIAQQIAMLDGAQIVFGVHGANFTNMAFLSPPVTIIEVMPEHRASSLLMQLSARLGFDHVAMLTRWSDSRGHLLFDTEQLERTLERVAA